jgi:hypothetical protein
MRLLEVVSTIPSKSVELGVIVVLGLVDAIYHAFFGSSSGSSRGDDES